jgi:hypothetical protein
MQKHISTKADILRTSQATYALTSSGVLFWSLVVVGATMDSDTTSHWRSDISKCSAIVLALVFNLRERFILSALV